VLVFPRDHGAHPAARIEWWYLTGWLAAPERPAAPTHGFQLTFFRSRGVPAAASHPSAFAAAQLLFAHAALTDLARGASVHDQRLARAGFGIAEARLDDADVRLRDWHLVREGPVGRSVYRAVARSEAAGFALALDCAATQPLLLQGDAGFSRKGPLPQQASHYYSEPQLVVRGSLGARPVLGRAWLDHEWSETVLADDAVGWDWIGINLLDGTALTAFRLRRADGTALWSGGSQRAAGASAQAFANGSVRFVPGRRWTSPATRTAYPVEWELETPAGRHRVRALADAQELDSRASTGAIYWEGLAELLDEGGTRVGLGYLEMTGYAARLRL
jgi:predicted secreted hydrolase